MIDVGNLNNSRRAFSQDALEASSTHLYEFRGQLEVGGFESQISRRGREDEAKIYVDDVSFRIEQNVSVMPAKFWDQNKNDPVKLLWNGHYGHQKKALKNVLNTSYLEQFPSGWSSSFFIPNDEIQDIFELHSSGHNEHQ